MSFKCSFVKILPCTTFSPLMPKPLWDVSVDVFFFLIVICLGKDLTLSCFSSDNGVISPPLTLVQVQNSFLDFCPTPQEEEMIQRVD